MTGTAIQWSDHTFNPWRGCVEVSPACAHCYAREQAKRNPAVLGSWGGPDNGTRVVAAPEQWRTVERYERDYRHLAAEFGRRGAAKPPRPRVFVASLADVFEDWRGPMFNAQGLQLWRGEVTGVTTAAADRPKSTFFPLTMDDVRADLFRLIDRCPNVNFLLLTKRPENVARMLPPWSGSNPDRPKDADPRYRRNVWLGCTMEDQQRANERAVALLSLDRYTPCLWVSVEPQLGPVDLTQLRIGQHFDAEGAPFYNAFRGASFWGTGEHGCNGPAIRWVICGGESGGQARPFNLAWARDLREQCAGSRAAFFMKQLGAVIDADDGIDPLDQFPRSVKNFRQGPTETTARIRLYDSHGGDPEEWPADLRIRQFPTVNPTGPY